MIHYLWQVIFIGQIRTVIWIFRRKNSIYFLSIDCNCEDKKSSKKVCDYVKSYSNVYGAVGIHPHEAKTVQQTDYDFIAIFISYFF